MARGRIWTGNVNFVLVSIPVEIVRAVREQRVSFRLMHEKDNAVLERRMYCPEDDRFIHREHIVNGYEVDSGRYVVVNADEYEALEPKRSRTIEIDSFVDLADIDPVYFDRPYYLVPREGGERTYQLLTDVMREKQKAGLAKFVLHNREHLVALWAQGKAMALMLLHYDEQVADGEEVRPKGVKPQAAKVRAMSTVMKKMRGEYDPADFVDEHRRRVLAFLKQKAEREGTVVAAEPEEEEQAVEQEEGQDLMAALEESLARARTR